MGARHTAARRAIRHTRIRFMFRWFETRIDPFVSDPAAQPPDRLAAFYWHFVRPVWPGFAVFLGLGLVAALIEVSLFAYLGRLVDLMRSAATPAHFFADHGHYLLWMAFVAA